MRDTIKLVGRGADYVLTIDWTEVSIPPGATKTEAISSSLLRQMRTATQPQMLGDVDKVASTTVERDGKVLLIEKKYANDIRPGSSVR